MMSDQETTKRIQEFIDDHPDREYYVEKAVKHVIIDFNELLRFDPDFEDKLHSNPDNLLKLAETVIGIINGKDIPIRIKGFAAHYNLTISNKRVEHIDKFWNIEGIVRKISEVKPIITSCKYECISCGNILNIIQLSSVIRKPSKCGCGNMGRFKELNVTSQDMMKLVLEEDIDVLDSTEQPEKLNVLLRQGLTDKQIKQFATPGKRIIITGILKAVPKLIKGKESTEREWIFLANYITPTDESELITISKEDEKKIKRYAKDIKIYDKLVDAVAPTVIGYEKEKLALVLQSFGGVNKRDKNTNRIIKRGYFHVGFIGDPSVAKTSIAKGLKRILPKCKSTSGKHASAAGLTWGQEYDDFMKAWTIEAGGMVLANGGTLIVDESDKIAKDDLGKMNQGLEDGIFEASKMGVHTTLKAETSCLFISNPKHGRFNPHEKFFDQFELDPTLVSRISMMFIFRDITDKQTDIRVAEHIFDTHQKLEKILDTELSSEFIKKYILYARRNCRPKLAESLKKYSAEKYAELREKGNVEGRIAITPRQYGDIINLSEAYAKIRLSKNITKEDMDNAFGLMIHSLKGFAIDSEGNIDIDVIEMGGKTFEVRNKSILFEETIKELKKEFNNHFETQELVNRLVNKGFSEMDAEKWIEKAMRAGVLYEPRRGVLSLL